MKPLFNQNDLYREASKGIQVSKRPERVQGCLTTERQRTPEERLWLYQNKHLLDVSDPQEPYYGPMDRDEQYIAEVENERHF